MRRLLISVPTAPFGKYHQELAWWLMAVQVQSATRDLAQTIADGLPESQLRARAQIRDMGDQLGIGWYAEQAENHWVDPRCQPHLWKHLIPDGWSVSFAPVPGAPLDANRNEQGRKFLFRVDHDKGEIVPSDYDAVLLIDADNIPDPHDLHKLLEHMDNPDVQVVGGVYCAESPKDSPQPLIYELHDEDQGFHFASREVVTANMGKKGLVKLEKGGLPTGCLLIRREVFQRMYEERRIWFKNKLRDGSFENYELRALIDQHEGDPEALKKALDDEVERRYKRDHALDRIGTWAIGEDIWFCLMCHEMGIPVHVDTRVFWGHIKLHDNRREFNRYEKLATKFFKAGAQAVDPDLTPKQTKHLYRSEMQRKAAVRADDKKEQP